MDNLISNSIAVTDRDKFTSNSASGPNCEASLSDQHFSRLSQFIHTNVGIKLPKDKKTMLEGRLQKRMRALGITSFSRYCHFLFSAEGMKNELTLMIDAITTNKTDFFREPAHFSFLTDIVLPSLADGNSSSCGNRLRIWSAGCSSGEEPYTLAMVLQEYAQFNADFSFTILATDICTKVLQMASTGIYECDRIEPIPFSLRRKYLLKSKDKNRNLVRIDPVLRQRVNFRRLNFMDDDFAIYEPMDIIFCRNVLIYFDKLAQERLLRKFCNHLPPGGFVFLGHSETINGMDVPLVQVASTIYRKCP
jgi:chemotaxis protein methyltransferase CheR